MPNAAVDGVAEAVLVDATVCCGRDRPPARAVPRSAVRTCASWRHPIAVRP